MPRFYFLYSIFVVFTFAYSIDDDDGNSGSGSGSGSGFEELVDFNDPDSDDLLIRLINDKQEPTNSLVVLDEHRKHLCTVGEIEYDDSITGRLFLFGNCNVGITDSAYRSVDVLKYNREKRIFESYFIKLMTYPRGEVTTYDTCSLGNDKNEDDTNLFTFFLNGDFIRRYRVSDESVFDIKENSVVDTRSMTCFGDRIFLASNSGSVIKVYDRLFRLKNKIHLYGTSLGSITSLSLKNGIGLLLDSHNKVGYFTYSLTSAHHNTRVSALYYQQRGCVNSIHLAVERNTNLFYISDNCTNSVKQYIYGWNSVLLLHEYKIGHKITSVVTNQDGNLIVLASEPRKLYVFDKSDKWCIKENYTIPDSEIVWF